MNIRDLLRRHVRYINGSKKRDIEAEKKRGELFSFSFRNIPFARKQTAIHEELIQELEVVLSGKAGTEQRKQEKHAQKPGFAARWLDVEMIKEPIDKACQKSVELLKTDLFKMGEKEQKPMVAVSGPNGSVRHQELDYRTLSAFMERVEKGYGTASHHLLFSTKQHADSIRPSTRLVIESSVVVCDTYSINRDGKLPGDNSTDNDLPMFRI